MICAESRPFSPQEAPRRPKDARRPDQGRLKSIGVPWFSQCFRFPLLSLAILPQHGHQDAPKMFPDSPRNYSGPLRDAPRSPQDAIKSSRISPRASPEVSKRRPGSVWETFFCQEVPKNCPESFQTAILLPPDSDFGDFSKVLVRFLDDFGSISGSPTSCLQLQDH